MTQSYVLLALAVVVALINLFGFFFTRKKIAGHHKEPKHAYASMSHRDDVK